MATTKLNLYNKALRYLGERTLANLTEERAPRRLLDDVYDQGGIEYCLEQGQWHFAMRTISIDYDTTIEPPFGYKRAFSKPADWVVTSALCSDEYFNTPITQYVDEAEYWFEPFGRKYYWNWDNYFFEAPQDATYTAILWHPSQEIGRYSFVIGQREEFGGDMECRQTLDNFWTPLVEGESPYTEEAPMAMSDSHIHEDGQEHDHSKQMDMSGDSAPFVDLNVIPLSDGSYNIRVQTLNFIFAPQNVNQEPIAGEGHAHLYVDGLKIARLYGEWFHLEALPKNAEVISVNLYANNHQALSVDGIEVSDMVMVADLMGDS